MASRLDRRVLGRFLQQYFPTMMGKSSDEWHGFLNAETGLSIELDEPNPSAFDKWRQALLAKGYPVWGHSKTKLETIAERAAMLKKAEDERRAKEADELARLNREAPTVSAKDLLK